MNDESEPPDPVELQYGIPVRDKEGNVMKAGWLSNAVSVVFALLVASGLVSRLVEDVDWVSIWSTLSSRWTQLIATTALVLFSTFLFNLRSRRPRDYAVLEGFVALTTGWLATSPSTSASTSERGAKAAAAVYLLIRARDNWSRKPQK